MSRETIKGGAVCTANTTSNNSLAPPAPLQPGDLLTPSEASAILVVDKLTLANWRSARKGPPWVRVGDRIIRYPRAGLAEFISAGVAAA